MPLFSLDAPAPTPAPVAVAPDVRAVVVDVLNKFYNKSADNTPVTLANTILKALDLDTLTVSLSVPATIPVKQDWTGEIDIDLSDIEETVNEAVKDDLDDAEDIELDLGYSDSVSAEVTVSVTGKIDTTVEIELEDGEEIEDLEEAVSEAAELDGDWEVDSDRSIEIDEANIERSFS